MSIFDYVSIPKVKKSSFDLSFPNVLTCNMGTLVPFMCEEVLPNDKFRCSADVLVRLMPQLAPVMSQVDIQLDYWYVPNRIIFDDWTDFIYGGADGTDNTVRPYVTLTSDNTGRGSLADYLNYPSLATNQTIQASALPFRAYDLIYNEWYRDENLIDPLPISKAGGEDTTTSLTLQNRAWEKDYFTSSLPWPQRGPAVKLPLTGDAPVYTSDNSYTNFSHLSTDTVAFHFSTTTGGSSTFRNAGVVRDGGSSVPADAYLRVPSKSDNIDTNLYADMSEVSSATVNDLRQAVQFQKWYERNARSGARNVEATAAHFGIRPPDARLQRPEFLGSSKAPIIFSEVLQTSSTDSTSPQANMAGHAFGAMGSKRAVRTFSEHGWLIGILSIIPRTLYCQGLPRKYSRQTRFDYFWREFMHLGEQPVLNKELYAGSTNPDGIFGYQGRFQEYRQNQGEIHGDFRPDPNNPTSDTNLTYWHLGRVFGSAPALNEDFINCSPSKRIFAVTDVNESSCLLEIANHITAWRPMSKRAEPGFIDHN